MKHKEINPESFLLASSSKIFYSNIFDAFLVFLVLIATFFGITKPILNATGYSDQVNEKDETSKKVINIAKDSKLLYYNEDKNAVSTVESVYKVYVYQNIKYCYEKYPDIYKKDLEDVGFETKKEFFETVKINDYENDPLAYFYTSYIVDKVNDDGNKVVDYKKENSHEYFVNDVLLKDEKAKEFFVFDGNYNDLPRLNKDVCRYLFQYNVMNVSYSTVRDIDNKFFNFFKDKYIEAGEVLLSYDQYSVALNRYNELYKILENKLLVSVILTFLVGVLVVYSVLPLIFKYSRTPGQMIFKLVRYDENKKDNKNYIATQTIFGFIKCFPILLPSAFIVGNGVNLLNFHFLEAGNFTLNILHIILLMVIVDIIWLIVLFTSKPKKGISSKITKTNYYEIIS